MRRKNRLRILKTGMFGGALMAGYWANGQTIAYDINQQGRISNVNGAIVSTYAGVGATGTGTFNPFLNLDGQTASTYEGISTGGPTMPDANSVWTKSLSITEMLQAVVSINSVNYVAIGIDLNENQSGGSPFVSLDSAVLYTAPSATGGNVDASSVPTFIGNPGLNPVPAWSLDTLSSLDPASVTTDRVLLFDTSIMGSGQGVPDIYLMIPETTINQSGQDYFYLYAHFGGAGTINGNNYSESSGFEEFGRVSGLGTVTLPGTELPSFNPAAVPETTSGSVVAMGLVAMGWNQIRRRRSGSSASA
jgi:hypothetical protein